MRYSRIFIYLFLLSSCVSPYDFSSSEYHEAVVVEGMITDQTGPYLVKISKAVPILNQVLKTQWITGASVQISDDRGNNETLHEASDGHYYTNSIQGVVGVSYTLSIVTKEGVVYTSSPEKLLPVGDFSNLHAEFRQVEEPTYYNQVKSPNGFNIYLDSDLLPEQESRAWWRWTGTFEIMTYPQFRTRPVPSRTGTTIVPDPVPCSGYISRGGALVQQSPCTCCYCWITQYNSIPEISDPQLVINGKLKNQYVGFVEANVRTFFDKYYLEVEQLSLSQSVYDFWKKVKVQKSNSSNLFQTPPPRSGSNISSTSPEATPVIGYFAASAVKKHVITILRSDVPYHLNPIDTLASSCVEAYKLSTTSRPVFW
ncbi:hypothetical protein WSM22_07410 [Cytophagales bacterium WSM2-2]|nr:hypothetical protein WSM22_07410 [Cytophagales bacterium WSM2-2]